MNRRSFFGTLLAAPIAAIMGLRLPFTWERPTATGIMGWDNMALAQPITFENIWKMIDSFKASEETWPYESILDMPKTKPYIDESWRRFHEALRKDT